MRRAEGTLNSQNVNRHKKTRALRRALPSVFLFLVPDGGYSKEKKESERWTDRVKSSKRGEGKGEREARESATSAKKEQKIDKVSNEKKKRKKGEGKLERTKLGKYAKPC